MTRAQLASNTRVVCGACGATLCDRRRLTLGGGPDGPEYAYVLLWSPLWSNEDSVRLHQVARKRGWVPTLGGKARASKSFGFDLPAECWSCKELNALDPIHLRVTDVPPSA